MSELAYWAFNIQEFSCTMAAGPKACLFTTDSCLYKNVPPWAFLALNAGANLGQNFRNIDVSRCALLLHWTVRDMTLMHGLATNI